MNKFKKLFCLVAFLCFNFIHCICSNTSDLSFILNPEEFVNPLQGTNSTFELSTGNTYPAIAVPWGMNFWTPQTRKNGNGWQYVYNDLKIQGFKQTHQPSPWINDYGCFSIMPQLVSPERDQIKRSIAYKREKEKVTPYLYDVTLDNGIRTEMTATNSGAAFRVTYNGKDNTYILIDCFNGNGEIKFDSITNTIIGYSSYYAGNNNINLPKNFRTYFVIKPSLPVKEFAGINSNNEILAYNKISGKDITAYISFGKVKKVDIKIASSFIGYDQANMNYERELGVKSFDTIKKENKDIWNKELSKIKVKGGTKDEQRTFYTAFYRTLLFPRKVHEYDNNGHKYHYSFYDGKIYEGAMYADNGFWDTFRAVHPFFTIMYPSLSAELMEALLNIYKEGGWLPEWFSPSYKDCMIGQNSVSVITDALVKGIDKFDKNLMLEAMLKGAENTGPNATGRMGIELYDSLGYIPCDTEIEASVSRTLEYSYNDFCISKYAEKIGASKKIVDFYKQRSYSYRNIIDRGTKFARPKLSNGNWLSPFSPDEWGRDFTEGSSWHWTWCVFHDVNGLINLIGGKDEFIYMLDSVFNAKPTVGLGGRKKMIHEMNEMIACDMGQYAHGNQPIQHMPYLYSYAGAPYKTQEKVHLITDKLYHSGINDGRGLCGDEDNGQTSAWYIFTALGFYPVCPGTGEYVIGSPMFKEAVLELEEGNFFSIKTENYSDNNIYIHSAKLNGKSFNKAFITHEQIVKGGEITFYTNNLPNKQWGVDVLPSSLSNK